MQLSGLSDVLDHAANHACSPVGAKSDVPILNNVVLTAGVSNACIRGTNMEMDLTVPFDAEIKESGQVCVNAKIFRNIAKRLSKGKQVSIVRKDNELVMRCASSTFKLPILPAEDYPSFEAQGAVSSKIFRFEIEADMLRRTYGAVLHAIAKDASRFYLCGIYFHVVGERLVAVATNGHQLAMESMLAPVGASGMSGIIVPSDTVAEMMKLLALAGSELVTLSVSERFIWMDFPDGLSMGSKLLDGTYPDYERVIPRGNKHAIRCSADALATAVDRVATICDANHTEVSIAIDPRGSSVKVISERSEIGVGQDRLETVEIEGPKRVLSFNYRYLRAMLSNYSGGAVELRYQDAGDPLLITLSGSDAGLQVLMPMRTASSAALAEAA